MLGERSLWWPESPATRFLSSFLSLLPHRNCPRSSKYPSTHLFTHPSAHPFTHLSTHTSPTIRPPSFSSVHPRTYSLPTHLPVYPVIPHFLNSCHELGIWKIQALALQALTQAQGTSPPACSCGSPHRIIVQAFQKAHFKAFIFKSPKD